jgi:hypothetical protein
MLAASLFDEYLPYPMPLQHSTDDVESAYRRMAAAHPEATVVAQFNTEANTVSYYTMDGFNFGISSAVLHFNRHSQNMSMLAKRFFGVCNAAFFDDYDVTEPTFTGASGKQVLRRAHTSERGQSPQHRRHIEAAYLAVDEFDVGDAGSAHRCGDEGLARAGTLKRLDLWSAEPLQFGVHAGQAVTYVAEYSELPLAFSADICGRCVARCKA